MTNWDKVQEAAEFLDSAAVDKHMTNLIDAYDGCQRRIQNLQHLLLRSYNMWPPEEKKVMNLKQMGLDPQGQLRHDDLFHNVSWYDIKGKKIGWGDLNREDLFHIRSNLREGEIFAIVPEKASWWDFNPLEDPKGAMENSASLKREYLLSTTVMILTPLGGHYPVDNGLCFSEAAGPGGYYNCTPCRRSDLHKLLA